MRISLDWVSDYLPTNLSLAEVSERLTATGLEVEKAEVFDAVPGGLRALWRKIRSWSSRSTLPCAPVSATILGAEWPGGGLPRPDFCFVGRIPRVAAGLSLSNEAAGAQTQDSTLLEVGALDPSVLPNHRRIPVFYGWHAQARLGHAGHGSGLVGPQQVRH